MAQDPFRSAGRDDGDDKPPLPGDGARDGSEPGRGDDEPVLRGPGWELRMPPPNPEADAAADAYLDWLIGEVDAGREQVPDDSCPPAAAFSLGEAGDFDLAGLARMTGPDGLLGLGFSQHETADALRPGPVLAALALEAAENVTGLDDDQVLGAASAARRLQAHAEWMELAAVAEFTRRREAAYAASRARGGKPGKRDGEYADSELAREFLISDYAAEKRMDQAGQLVRRLPETFAGMKAGTISGNKAAKIVDYTRYLSDAKAAEADRILAAAAPALSPAQLKAKAARLEMRLDPEGVKRRREETARRERRVEAGREQSGNSFLSGRELEVTDAMAADAAIKAAAVALRNAGMEGSLRELRTRVFIDRLCGLNPHDRLAPFTDPDDEYDDDGDPADIDGGPGDSSAGAGSPACGPAGADADGAGFPAAPPDDDGADGESGQFPGSDGGEDEDDEDDEGRPAHGAPRSPAGGPAPMPALINVIVPAGTLLGWSDAPAEAGSWGLLDRDAARTFLAAASRHPRARWCVTVTGNDGQAIAHGCARGRHPWSPPGGRDGPPGPAAQSAQLADLLRRLNVTLAPIARSDCDHRYREDQYTPSRKLKHLIRARTARCCAPGCHAQAINCEIDHTIAYPAGPTDLCNLAPACPRHHHAKHAPDWKLEQPEPGVMKWTPPSGRTYETGPAVYET